MMDRSTITYKKNSHLIIVLHLMFSIKKQHKKGMCKKKFMNETQKRRQLTGGILLKKKWKVNLYFTSGIFVSISFYTQNTQYIPAHSS